MPQLALVVIGVMPGEVVGDGLACRRKRNREEIHQAERGIE